MVWNKGCVSVCVHVVLFKKDRLESIINSLSLKRSFDNGCICFTVDLYVYYCVLFLLHLICKRGKNEKKGCGNEEWNEFPS
jgi:hypothetical protein